MKTVPEPAPTPARPEDGLQHDQRRARRPNTSLRLHRSGSQRWLAGVCGGIADYVGMTPTSARLLWIVFSLLPGPLWILYVVLWVALPEEYT